jgi:hypothetical protein
MTARGARWVRMAEALSAARGAASRQSRARARATRRRAPVRDQRDRGRGPVRDPYKVYARRVLGCARSTRCAATRRGAQGLRPSQCSRPVRRWRFRTTCLKTPRGSLCLTDDVLAEKLAHGPSCAGSGSLACPGRALVPADRIRAQAFADPGCARSRAGGRSGPAAGAGHHARRQGRPHRPVCLTAASRSTTTSPANRRPRRKNAVFPSSSGWRPRWPRMAPSATRARWRPRASPISAWDRPRVRGA